MTHFLSSRSFAIVAAGTMAALFSTSAMAADHGPAGVANVAADTSAVTSNTTTDAPAATGTARTDDRKICLSSHVTGSIMAHKVCKTRTEWEADGATFATK